MLQKAKKSICFFDFFAVLGSDFALFIRRATMLQAQKEKLQNVVEIINKVSVNPDVEVDYFIPGVLVTEGADGAGEIGGPYVQFTYSVNGDDPHVQHMPLTHGYLEKDAEDLANLITFSLERFMEEMDSRQYGAQ
jgi:hypothetical protein